MLRCDVDDMDETFDGSCAVAAYDDHDVQLLTIN